MTMVEKMINNNGEIRTQVRPDKQKVYEVILANKVIDLLSLKRRSDKFATSLGDKTMVGLGATLVRIIEEAKDEANNI